MAEKCHQIQIVLGWSWPWTGQDRAFLCSFIRLYAFRPVRCNAKDIQGIEEFKTLQNEHSCDVQAFANVALHSHCHVCLHILHILHHNALKDEIKKSCPLRASTRVVRTSESSDAWFLGLGRSCANAATTSPTAARLEVQKKETQQIPTNSLRHFQNVWSFGILRNP